MKLPTFIIFHLVCISYLPTFVRGKSVMRLLNIKAKAECHSNEFKCDSGKCIIGMWRCDGSDDCGDNSDERGCASTKCTPGSFFCEYSKKCIDIFKRCNGHYDCGPYGEDETNCGSKACTTDQFRCHTSTVECIPKSKMCNNKRECSDGSDEDIGVCREKGVTPRMGKCPQAGEFFCADDGVCIPDNYVCDGSQDCQGGYDEMHCNQTINITDTCKKDEFKCFQGPCIPKQKRCDDVVDCRQKDDELGCVFQCPKDLFKCDNENKCLNSSQKCDGKADCIDRSDEKNCPTPKPDVKSCDQKSYFNCDGSGKECIPWSKVCDKKIDCRLNKGADENHPNCSRNTCDTNNGGCSHSCTFDAKSKTHTCGGCPTGYHINPRNNRTCIDIDECKQNYTCSHYCHNRPGGYICTCPKGYIKEYKGSSRCIFSGDKALMFSAQKDVREYKFSHNELRTVASGLDNAVGFDIDQNRSPRIIYWSTADGEIGELKLTNSDPRKKILIAKPRSTPDGLMFDWTNDLLYWTDTGLDRIEVMNVSNGQHTVLLEGKKWLDEPRAIVVDPKHGWLYWSDWGARKAKISKMGMNGQDVAVLLDQKSVECPNALALDLEDEKLYYGDAKLSKIGCIDLRTGSHRDIVVNYPIYPFAMIVFEDRVYWSDWRYDAIFSVDKLTGKGLKKIAHTSKPMTLRMIHRNAQPKMIGRCNNHRCSHICLPSPDKDLYSCACPINMELRSNGRTCIQANNSTLSKSSNSYRSKDEKPPKTPKSSESYQPNVGLITGITIGVIITVTLVAVITGIVLYGRYAQRARTRTIHFDNAGLIKTSEDLFALTRSNSSMRSMKFVPSSSQPLWSYQTNNDLMEDALRDDVKV